MSTVVCILSKIPSADAADELLDSVRARTATVVRIRHKSLTPEQRQDIEAIARCGVGGDFFDAVGLLDMSQCFAVMSVVGQLELPKY